MGWNRSKGKILLHDETLTSTGTFDVTGISQDYDDLLILLNGRTEETDTVSWALVYLNNDTTPTNYHYQYHVAANGAFIGATEAASSNFSYLAGASSPANSFAFTKAYIPLYSSTSMLKIMDSEFSVLGAAGAITVGRYVTVWEDGGATAINRVTIVTDTSPTNDFVAGSRLRIVGVKYR